MAQQEGTVAPAAAVLVGSSQTLKYRKIGADWMSSWVGFTSALCLSHPFSTMAVRWQTLNRRPLDSIRIDGIRSLYAGIIPPMIFAGPFVASTFATNEYFRQYFRQDAAAPLTTFDLLRAGFMSRITMSVVACPMAFIRVQQQNAGVGGNPKTTFVGTVKTTYARHGVIGFYRAWHVDIVASSSAWMVYFTAYDVAKAQVARALGKPAPQPGEKAPVFDSVLAGLATSFATWSLCMPTDLLRNRMQADAARDLDKRLYAGAWDCVLKTYRADGVRGFWRGVGLVMARSATSSCVSLPVYDRLKPRFRRWLGVESA